MGFVQGSIEAIWEKQVRCDKRCWILAVRHCLPPTEFLCSPGPRTSAAEQEDVSSLEEPGCSPQRPSPLGTKGTHPLGTAPRGSASSDAALSASAVIHGSPGDSLSSSQATSPGRWQPPAPRGGRTDPSLGAHGSAFATCQPEPRCWHPACPTPGALSCSWQVIYTNVHTHTHTETHTLSLPLE